MKNNIIETLVGFLIIIIAGAFLFYAYKVSNSSRVSDGYLLNASFENIEGISVGSDVKLSGIKVGFVDDIILDKDTFFAKVTFSIASDVLVPKDSRVIVSTSGLIGNKYIRINPGASDVTLSGGDKFIFTQSALNIEDLIAKLMYSLTSK